MPYNNKKHTISHRNAHDNDFVIVSIFLYFMYNINNIHSWRI